MGIILLILGINELTTYILVDHLDEDRTFIMSQRMTLMYIYDLQ